MGAIGGRLGGGAVGGDAGGALGGGATGGTDGLESWQKHVSLDSRQSGEAVVSVRNAVHE